MREPAVSIITPTRNRAALLVETLDSVATQALDDWEHLVVDDGSDDGTAELMARRTATDRRVRYLVREHDPSGANACRNIGLRAARAALVLMLDSDDLLSADCLARRVRIMQRNPDFDFATFQSAVFTDQIGDYPREVLNEIAGDDLCRFLTLREAPWIITAPIWRREALLGIGGFDERLPSLQDSERRRGGARTE